MRGREPDALKHAFQAPGNREMAAALLQSLQYVVMYDGLCYKREGRGWHSCKLSGEEAYFTEIYLAQPHELDAVNFACHIIKNLACDNHQAELEALRRSGLPPYLLIKEADMPAELERIYGRIDKAIFLNA